MDRGQLAGSRRRGRTTTRCDRLLPRCLHLRWERSLACIRCSPGSQCSLVIFVSLPGAPGLSGLSPSEGGQTGSLPKCLTGRVLRMEPPLSVTPKSLGLTHRSCSSITQGGRGCQGYSGFLPPPPPVMPKQPEAWYFEAARSWHGALVVPPLPGECVGRLQLHSCLARGKERREMSRWIYLEPDFPPTASEGASGRARSQAGERGVGEGNPGAREE